MKLIPTKIHGWPEPVLMPESTITKKQKKSLDPRITNKELIVPRIRWDDECGNGHNSFSVTADGYSRERIPYESTIIHDGKTWWMGSCGCLHDEVEKSHPEIAHLIKWHMMSSNGPWGYIENTIYHAREHGPQSAWLRFTDPAAKTEQVIKYGKIVELKKEIDSVKDEVVRSWYRIDIDPKTAKAKNLDYARNSACWPDATDEQLLLPPEELTKLLVARLPDLMVQFYNDVTKLGFTY